jgi:hypothetical protein
MMKNNIEHQGPLEWKNKHIFIAQLEEDQTRVLSTKKLPCGAISQK